MIRAIMLCRGEHCQSNERSSHTNTTMTFTDKQTTVDPENFHIELINRGLGP